MDITEFVIEVEDRKLTCCLGTPRDARPSAESALLLNFSGTRQRSLREHPYDLATKVFTGAGHAVLSFDMPNHGDRIDPYGEGLSGMCAALMAGKDPFVRFIADGIGALNACLGRGIGVSGKIFAYGISRGGYCALRLAAADARIQGVAGLSPVTDWRALKEFAEVRHLPEVEALRLDHQALHLAHRPVFLAIGNRDGRVGTDCCMRFALRLFEAEAGRGESSSQVHAVDAPGHGLPDEYYIAGGQFLLQLCDDKKLPLGGGR